MTEFSTQWPCSIIGKYLLLYCDQIRFCVGLDNCLCRSEGPIVLPKHIECDYGLQNADIEQKGYASLTTKGLFVKHGLAFLLSDNVQGL